MSERVKFHIVHARVSNPGRYAIAREDEREVRYWSDERGAWVYHPGGSLYPSKRAAERRLEECKDVTA